jgi:hypothetical protein
MALVATFDLAENMITSVLSQVRRGVSLSRMDNTANSTRGSMVDLPDRIDFEINLLKFHQSLSRETTSSDNNNSVDVESLISIDVESSGNTETSSDLSGSLGGSLDGGNSRSGESSSDSGIGTERSTTSGVGGSSDSSGSGGTENRSSKKTENGTENSSSNSTDTSNETSNSTENSTETRQDSSNRGDSECSDKWVTSKTTRNYWKLDEDTGGVTQAS